MFRSDDFGVRRCLGLKCARNAEEDKRNQPKVQGGAGGTRAGATFRNIVHVGGAVARAELRRRSSLRGWLRQELRDRVKRLVRLRSVWTARLRHIRAPAAAFAAQLFRGDADQIYCVETRRQIGGDGDYDAALAVVGGIDDGHNSRTDLAFAFVGQCLQVFHVDARDAEAEEVHATDVRYRTIA